jgi:hypothetical protein
MHLLSLFILVKRCTCFGLSVHHQELETAYTATGICQTAAATCCYRGREMEPVASRFQ